jgi:hypothetical protein
MTWSEFFETAAKFAPLGTVSVALVAAGFAWRAMYVQRDIARRRAAIDFFLKTETDPAMINLYDTFKAEIRQVVQGAPMNTVIKSEHYGKIRGFLNLCELIAVGVRRKAFSDDVSFHYWGDVLRDSFRDARPLIDHVREQERKPATYLDLEWLCCEKWRDRD